MLHLNRKYRRTYAGENIIAERVMVDGKWLSTTEYVPNNIINSQISNRAVVFGNGPQRNWFDIDHLMKHKSGLLGSQTMQKYGCNGFFRDYTPDFLIVTDRRIAREISIKGYTIDNIVYTRADITLDFPRQFYLIPHDPYADAGSTALYIAAFDGHKKIYMLGFDGQDTPGMNQNVYAGTLGYDSADSHVDDTKWRENQATVFRTYPDVDFVFVSKNGRNTFPECWKYCTNLRQIDFRSFVLEADL